MNAAFAALGFGINIEIGIATNEDTGYQALFVRGGSTLGDGASAGLEISRQEGTLRNVLGRDAVEFEYDLGPLGGNVAVDSGVSTGSSPSVGGGGVNGGLGLFKGFNFTNFSFISPAAKVDSQRNQRCTLAGVGLLNPTAC